MKLAPVKTVAAVALVVSVSTQADWSTNVGYGREVDGFDVGVSLIFASDDLVGDADESLVFTLGKSFSF